MKKIIILTGALLLASSLTWSAAAGEHTLKTIMQGLGSQMGRLAEAIMADDMDVIRQASEAIADHPKPSLGERLQLLGRIGTNVGVFREKDAEVHDMALVVKNAAEAGDQQAVVDGFRDLMIACLSCHNQFRDLLRDEGAAENGPDEPDQVSAIKAGQQHRHSETGVGSDETVDLPTASDGLW